MKGLFGILLFMACFVKAQDKLVFTNGNLVHGKFLSVSSSRVYFVCKDSVQTSMFDRKSVLFVETEAGNVQVFGTRQEPKRSQPGKTHDSIAFRNIAGLQPFGILVGRLSLCYERLSGNGQLGLVLPFSLTFDPSAFYNQFRDTALDVIPGLSFITGLDLNYYLKVNRQHRAFIGPRLRYGTDLLMGGIEGLSLQFQMGWCYWSARRLVQHLSFGYGFVQVLNVPSGSGINPDQLYGWFSLNYRVGLRW